MSSGFVHLHVHSHYSFLDGACRLDKLVERAAEDGASALAVTDHGNLFGALEFYDAAKKAGIKPILGMEAYISPTNRTDRSMGKIENAAYHLLLLAMNAEGWANLVKLSSRAYMEGFYYRPRIDRELLSQLNAGLVASTACLGGEVASALIRDDPDKALRLAGEYVDIFGKDRFFVEIQRQGYPEQEKVNPGLVKIAKELGVGLIGTNDAHFLRREDKAAHEILTCIATGKTLSPEQKERYSPEMYLKTAAEMKQVFAEWPEAITNTEAIAEMCDLQLDFSEPHLPVFATPEGVTPDDYLRDLSEKGLAERFPDGIPEGYADRLEWELKVIRDKGYSSYFLIIHDAVMFAADNHIPVAPRGSGVATLLGYAIRVSEIDPVKYGLLFERFTDPQRDEDPDVDLDICQEGRNDVIRYVREKYGHVAQIITYGTLKARAAIRDVGRVLDVPLSEVDLIAKAVPDGLGVTLQSALEKDAQFREKYENDRIFREVVDHAGGLEGLIRHSGVHAAGIVVCDQPLENFLPLYKQSNSDDAITQWDGNTCGKVGMMKMDFLGLRTLTILQRCREMIRERTGTDVDPEKLPLDDQDVFTLFREGKTDGVFQFESEGMKSVLMQMKPNRVEDLIAANAMYRPGPMALIPAYCNRKHGKDKVPAIHEAVDDILSETYGIMAYQEQVMQVLNKLLGNLPLNTALTLIKAISKKKEKVIAAERPNFIEGAKGNGISEAEADKLFELILEFAGYGFNKAHSTRYAIVAYQAAYFKVHYPAVFLASTLTYESVDRDKVVQYMNEASRMEVSIGPPDVNSCGAEFAVDGDLVRFGLSAVKGVGSKAVDAIVAAREEVGGFRDLYHFCSHVDLRAVNRSTIETLIKCGAFDAVDDIPRSRKVAALEGAIQAGQAAAADRQAGQFSLFGEEETETAITATYPDVPEWTREETLKAEKDTLGFYVTSHPLADHSRVVDDLSWPQGFTLSKMDDMKESDGVACGCLISQCRIVVAKSGRSRGMRMAIVTIEDLSGRCEAVMFPKTFEKLGEKVSADSLVYLRGTVLKRNERTSMAIDEIMPIAGAVSSATDCVTVRMPGDGVDDSVIDELREALKRNTGRCSVVVRMSPENCDGALLSIKTAEGWHVSPSDKLLEELAAIVGEENVTLSPRKVKTNGNGNGKGRKYGKKRSQS